MELVLFHAVPQRDVKELAKTLIARFGSFAEAVNAPPDRLAEIKGVGDAIITELKLVAAAASLVARGESSSAPMLSSWQAVIDLLPYRHGILPTEEQFRVLFLDKSAIT